MPTTKEILIAARKLIEREEDWCQAGGAPGKNCAQTAIHPSLGREYQKCRPALMALAKAVGAADIPGVWAWNDKPGRTHAEVLAAFDKAIAAS